MDLTEIFCHVDDFFDHTRHRSPHNFFVNLLSGLACYSMMPKKPSLDIRVAAQMCFPF